MTLERPPRLEDGDLGPIMRAAKRVDIAPERLAENGKRVKALIAAGTTTILWKLLGLLALLALIGGPIAYLATRGEPRQAKQALPPIDVPLPEIVVDAEVAIVEPDAAPPPAAPPHRPPHHVAAVVVDAGADAPPPSDLPAQIELYNQARAAAAARDFTTALDRVDELLRRFPATPLRADAELTRADVLARSGKLADAVTAFDALARDDAHRGRRGEILRTLGDLYRQLNDCTHATDAYTRALAEHLSARDREDVQRGRDRCTPH